MIAGPPVFDDHDLMSTSDPGDPTSAATPDGTDEEQRRGRNPWMWGCLALLVVAAGLLIWGLSLKSDRDDAQEDTAKLQAQIDQGKDQGSSVVTEAKGIYDEVTAQLGSADEDLAAVEQELEKAKKVAVAATAAAVAATTAAVKAGNESEAAQKEADAAKKDAEAADKQAADATSDTEKAQAQSDKAKAQSKEAQAETDKAKADSDKAKAESDKAKAESDAVKSKAEIAVDCAKSYISAFGGLFGSGDVKSQASAVRADLKKITADCKDALAAI